MALNQFYTPSSAYAEARSRSPKHDVIQERLLRSCHRASLKIGTTEYVPEDALPEAPFVLDGGGIIGFADVAQCWCSSRSKPPERIRLFYEVKPEVHSVGGLIRQLRATEHNAIRAGEKLRFAAVAVICPREPNLRRLESMWNGGIMTLKLGDTRGWKWEWLCEPRLRND